MVVFLKRFKNITVNKDGSVVLFVLMTIMMIVKHYLLEILFIGLHLVEIMIEDGTTTEPLSKRMLITQIIHNLRILIETMNFTYIVISQSLFYCRRIRFRYWLRKTSLWFCSKTHRFIWNGYNSKIPWNVIHPLSFFQFLYTIKL